MVRLGREARGGESVEPVRKSVVVHRAETDDGDPNPLLKDLAAVLPLSEALHLDVYD
jgi:hypothetical protein